MSNRKVRSYARLLCKNRGGVAFKALSAAVLAGAAGLFVPSFAGESATIDLSQKPIETPTLDYLQGNGILIPQKGEWDSATSSWGEAAPIESPGSAYTITEVKSADDSTFEYKVADDEGNLTSKYYKVDLKPSSDTGSINLGTSNNISWQEVSSLGENTISVDLPNGETRYYKYTYKMPSDYTTIQDQTGSLEFIKYSYGDYYAGGVVKVPEGETTTISNKLFLNNNTTYNGTNHTYVYGGALYNAGTIENLTADFIGNSVTVSGSDYGYGSGGAIYNNSNGAIGDITGDFVGNSLTGYGSGGAIYNGGTIGDITGDFIGNTAGSEGGAIYNDNGTIGDITGDFIGNTARRGGAIYNSFSFSSSSSSSSSSSIIGDITGDFIGNSVTGSDSGSGGAIYNVNGTIGDITGDFIGNSVTSSGYGSGSGGAIYNRGTIGDITGDFIGNSITSSDYSSGKGGAIYNYSYSSRSIIGNITGDFIGNSVTSSKDYGYGGAICNDNGTIGDITGDFIGNSVTSSKGYGYGGAISNYNNGTIGDITGDFIGNTASFGGAIYNGGTIGNITGDFIGNSVTSSRYGSGYGGAIYNAYGIIGDITGDFIGNSVNVSASSSSSVYGGAIYNGGTIGDITGDFIGNSVNGYSYGSSQGGAIYNYKNATIGNITGDFVNNSVNSYGASGGAIYNTGTITSLVGDFIGNNTIVACYDSNNSARNIAKGGAIYNAGTIGEIVNSSFIENYAKSTNADAKGGAIYSRKLLNIIADNGVSEFTGNYIQVANGEKDYQAIYAPKLNFTAKNSGRIIMNDKMTFSSKIYEDSLSNTYLNSDKGTLIDKVLVVENLDEVSLRLNIEGDSDSLVQINNDVELDGIESIKAVIKDFVVSYGTAGQVYIDSMDDITLINLTNDYLEITLSDTNLHLGVRDNVIDGHNLTLNSGLMSMANNQAGVSSLHKLTVAGDTNFVADVDLENKEMDRFTAEEYGTHTGNLNVVGMNLLSDANPNDEITAVYFAQPGLKNNVTHAGLEVPSETYQNFEVYTPIYKYNVRYDNEHEYDNKGDGGYFLFTKGDKYITSNGGTVSTGNPSDAFNPSVLSAPVSSVAASQATINETFKYVFEHADAFTQMPYHARMAQINANKYALRDGASTDFNHNLGSLCLDHNNKAGWFRPYATFETMNLKNGPKVNATTYGSLAGFDTDFHEHKNGWHSVGTGYIGYNGSQLSYKGVDTTLNGGILGYTHTMYKGNFWSALTLSAGASVGESRTMYGKEDFTSLMAGVGSKTGYNFEFKEGKYILQPIMFMSYTFVNTFDYTNAAGVKINADPAHSIQLNPSVRFISNFKNGWQPYASVGMVWNVMNDNNVSANNVKLPEMSMKPYVEYGVGVQRNWKDKFTAFGQAMLRNGGRNGIALTAGFRWALGNDTPHHHVNDKVESPKSDRTVLKQLTPQQKMALTGKKSTTITSSKAVLRQL